jgi:thiamine-phosphate pyrophosphorylase
MELLVISPSKTSAIETKMVTELFEHGLEIFHLRKPSMTTKEMSAYISAIPAHFHSRIIIHSHHRLVKKFQLKGIHLTRQHLKRKFYTSLRVRLLQMRRPGIKVTTSFHKLANVYQNKKNYDYVLLGTIFDSVSEKFNAGYNANSLKAALSKSLIPVVARGGTNVDNIATCKELGFAGMIFYSGIWKSENPVEAFCKIIEKNRELANVA